MIFPVEKEKNSEIIAIIGLSKNSGKTSFLNWLNNTFPADERGIITTGRDGEDFDLVGGNKKPKVYIPANTFFSTFAHIAQSNSPFIKIIRKLPFQTGGKTLWLVKSLVALNTEIVGPSSVNDQIELSEIILAEGAEQILIDGSLDRKSILLSPKIKNFFLVVSPEVGSKSVIFNELSRVVELSKIPLQKNFNDKSNITIQYDNHIEELDFASLYGNEKKLLNKIINQKNINKIYIPGAITDKSWKIIKATFLNFNFDLILKNAFNIHLNFHNFENMKKNIKLYTQHPIKLLGIVVNSFAVNGEHIDCDDLRNSIRFKFPDVKVFDITEASVKIGKRKKIFATNARIKKKKREK